MRTFNKSPLYLSIASFFISSMTIWFTSLGVTLSAGGNRTLLYIFAVTFWLFFILGFVFLRPIGKQRKKDRQYKGKSGIGLLRFFSNKPALVFDSLLIAGALALILAFIFPKLPGWMITAATFTLVFSAEMHGIFNGNNYEYLNADK